VSAALTTEGLKGGWIFFAMRSLKSICLEKKGWALIDSARSHRDGWQGASEEAGEKRSRVGANLVRELERVRKDLGGQKTVRKDSRNKPGKGQTFCTSRWCSQSKKGGRH